jgi:hypothetical protein
MKMVLLLSSIFQQKPPLDQIVNPIVSRCLEAGDRKMGAASWELFRLKASK